MTIKSPKDFWSGLMFIGFGLFFMLYTIGTPEFLNNMLGYKLIPGYQLGTAVRMGPGYFPVVLGGLLAVLGAVVFVGSITSDVRGEAAKLHLPFNIIDLAIAVGIFAVMGYVAKRSGIANDYAMLASALVVSALSVLYRPEARPLVLLSAACIAYGFLMKPLGLVGATAALVYVSAYGGHEFKWKEVTILYLILVVFSWAVFVKGLTLPFPVWPAAFE